MTDDCRRWKPKSDGRIAAAGPMPVAQYMTLCLTHPQHGYYITRDPFGADGDFITAPEISQMFGELIGLWAPPSGGRWARRRTCGWSSSGPAAAP